MHARRTMWALPFCLALVTTCAPPKRDADVWDHYDVRHPVSGEVPDGYARQYDNYIDNDQYYYQPDCTIMDSPNCGG